MPMFLKSSFTKVIQDHYGDALSGMQLIHEHGEESRTYIVYTSDGRLDVIRLFPSYYDAEIQIKVVKRVEDIDHTVIPLQDLMGIVETVVNAIKGAE